MALTQISTAGVKDDAVTSGKIPANAVGSSELADNAVDTAAIADGAVTNAKIASGISASKITGLATDSITEGNSTAEVLDTGSNGIFRFLPEGSEVFRIATDGKVGIGTNNPTEQLSITNSSSGGSQMQFRDNATGTGASDGFRVGYNGSGGQLWNFENNYVRIATNNTERMRIDSSGNVGIGSTTPESKLAIKGSSGSGDLFSISDIAVPTSGDEYGVAMIKSNAAANMLSITGYNSNAKGVRIYNNGGSAGRTSFEIAQAAGTKFLVDGVGNVGIANSIPNNFHSSGSNLVVGSGSGDEGITLYTGSGSHGCINFADGTSGSESYMGRILYRHGDNAMSFHTNTGTERMRILSGGGITFNGDTAANNALDDFEKGAWTPRIGPISNNSVYESGVGTYTKVGDKVRVYYAFINKNPNSFGSAVVRIWNLPYNIRHASNVNSAYDYGTCNMMHNITFNHNGKTVLYTNNNTSELIGLESRTGTTWVNWHCNSFANGFYLHGHLTYFTDNY